MFAVRISLYDIFTVNLTQFKQYQLTHRYSQLKYNTSLFNQTLMIAKDDRKADKAQTEGKLNLEYKDDMFYVISVVVHKLGCSTV